MLVVSVSLLEVTIKKKKNKVDWEKNAKWLWCMTFKPYQCMYKAGCVDSQFSKLSYTISLS